MPSPNARNSLAIIAQFLQRLQWVAIAVAILTLLYLLSPILVPFIVAAMLGWLGDPVVDWLEAKGRTRNQGVTIVTLVMCFLALFLLLSLLPMLQRQVVTLIDALPTYKAWFDKMLLPWIDEKTGLRLRTTLDMDHLTEMLRQHWSTAGSFAGTVLQYVTTSGFAVAMMVGNLVLIPILTFFYLRDWDLLVAKIASLVPREHIDTVERLARESSAVLSGFLRGQFLVMAILGVLYGAGLWMAGISLGLLIGIIAGLATFVPYLGPASGIILGVLAALVQYGDVQHVMYVLIVFGIGQVVESYFLTPRLVGDRIGLSQVAVIFAVLAGGQLFGFVGMLLALPVAAVANVLLRYAHQRYVQSDLYRGEDEAETSIVLADPQALSEAIRNESDVG